MKKSKPLAECAIVVEPSIDYSDIRKDNMYWFSSKGETRQLSPDPLFQAAQYRNMESYGIPAEMLDGYLAKAEKEAEGLRSRGMEELAGCVLEGRVRLSLLLDTEGGPGFYQSNIGNIKKFLSQSGGEFMTFGGVHVLSLGAQLLMTAAKGDRYVHPMSQVLFHLGEPDPRAKLSKRDRRRGKKWDIEELYAKLVEEAAPEKRKEMAEWLKTNLLAKNPKSEDRPVNLSGKSMNEWGMAKALKVEPMRLEYLRRHGIGWESVRGTPIDHFFGRLQRYEVKSRSQIKKLLAIFEAADEENDE